MKWFNKKKDEIKSKKSNKKDSLKVKRNKFLPKDFHQRVIELENQCERPDANKWHISDLMELYTVGIIILTYITSKPLNIITVRIILKVRIFMK